MTRYPMLSGMDEQRVQQVGGKAAILEEILKRWPEAPIPPLEVHEFSKPNYRYPQLLRASSELDIFGGCGLLTTVSVYNTTSLDTGYENIKSPDFTTKEKIEKFAESIGKSYTSSSVILQDQMMPNYWVIVMEHPNDSGTYLINYSTGPSLELTRTVDEVYEFLDRGNYQAIYQNGSVKIIQGPKKSAFPKNVILKSMEQAVETYQHLDSLKIVSPDWVSIFEGGAHIGSKMDVYQFTPIRRKTPTGIAKIEAYEDIFFGKADLEDFPIVNLPHSFDVDIYAHHRDGSLTGYPHFKKWFDPKVDHYQLNGKYVPIRSSEKFLMDYIEDSEIQYPGGYILLCHEDQRQDFDLVIKNAKAAILQMTHDPIASLNHDVSRLIAKISGLVLSSADINSYDTGNKVDLYLDGTEYKITKAKN